MMQPPSALLYTLTILILPRSSLQSCHYVKPIESLTASCPGSSCLTIDQYMNQAYKYFVTGSTFVFLAGNHILETALNLTNVSNITLKGDTDSKLTIYCGNTVHIRCDNVNNLTIQELVFELYRKEQSECSALRISNSREVVISNSSFQGQGDTIAAYAAKALRSVNSEITITNSLFEGNNGEFGGAVSVYRKSNLTLVGNVFTRNKAQDSGGALFVKRSSVSILEGSMINQFSFNSCPNNGGAISCIKCTVNITGSSSFEKNYCLLPPFLPSPFFSTGGALSIDDGSLSISGTTHFSNNNADHGGAIYIIHSNVSLSGPLIVFDTNSAQVGGGLQISPKSSMVTDTKNLFFVNNYAHDNGGAISIGTSAKVNLYKPEVLILISGSFESNRAKFGGAVSIFIQKVTVRSIKVTGNSDSALYFSNSNVTFEGTTRITANTGRFGGGGIKSKNSFISFAGETWFDGNNSTIGGAIKIDYGSVSFRGVTIFTNNSAVYEGGAIHGLSSTIKIKDTAKFQFNTAQKGGAIYLIYTYLILDSQAHLNTSYNTASDYGGVIYYKDTVIPTQCRSFNRYNELPRCFLQLDKFNSKPTTIVHSLYNTAGIDGRFLYGGLLDKCRLNWNSQYQSRTEAFSYYMDRGVINIASRTQYTQALTSEPYKLCFCDTNQTYDCERSKVVDVHRGQKFTFSFLALGQGGAITPAKVIASTSHNSRLKLLQSDQSLPKYCSNLTFNLYSTKAYENMKLYLKGPCYDIGLASVTISVTLLPCPDGFTQFGEECICEERLRQYDTNCTIGDEFAITKKAGSTFWMSALYKNGSYAGLVLSKICPFEYCKANATSFTLDNLDIQCALNRNGVLCGACATNYSLLLGSSRCAICINTYLALLLPFACVGICLVAFLTFLKLTVATGFLNSLILYANIVQVNRKLLFPINTVNVLTIFIAWLNLDLGIETCFYNGLDAYTQIWLQFAFPIYVWVLISLIIVTSRYSVTVSKVIGSNPIAVLATLLLMSYTKLLKIIIEVYSYVELDYPDKEQIKVWLIDSNVPYLESKHLLLTVVTTIILTFLFLPYTLLLLLGHKLYTLSGRRYLHWLNRIKPLLDSYYAPYKLRMRYWTGFLLLVRCALYFVFSYNSLGGMSKSLLAIIIAFTAIVSKVWFSGQIYKNFHVNVIEVMTFLNLIILSASTLAQVALVYSLVGIAFTTMIGIIIYHFHLLYTAKTTAWLKIKTSVCNYLKGWKTSTVNTESNSAVTSEPPRFVSATTIDLREPLLELDNN